MGAKSATPASCPIVLDLEHKGAGLRALPVEHLWPVGPSAPEKFGGLLSGCGRGREVSKGGSHGGKWEACTPICS